MKELESPDDGNGMRRAPFQGRKSTRFSMKSLSINGKTLEFRQDSGHSGQKLELPVESRAAVSGERSAAVEKKRYLSRRGLVLEKYFESRPAACSG